MRDATAEACSDDEAGEGRARPGTRIFTGQLFRRRDGKGWAFSDEPPEPEPEPVRRPARVAQMLALAHALEAAIERGEVKDRADVARRLGLTRARITQLLDLTLLAPDIQEAVLELEAVDGVEPMSERRLREIVRHGAWDRQRQEWRRVGRGGVCQRSTSAWTVAHGHGDRG